MRCCSLTEDDTRCPNTAVKGYSVCPSHWIGESPPPTSLKRSSTAKEAVKIRAKVKRLQGDVSVMLGGDKNDNTMLAGMMIIGAIRFATMNPDTLARHFKVCRRKTRVIVKRLRECRIWEGNLMDIGMWMEGDDEAIRLVSFILQALAGAGLVVPKKKGDLFTRETKWRTV